MQLNNSNPKSNFAHFLEKNVELLIGVHHTLAVFCWPVDKNNVQVAAVETFGSIPVSGQVNVATA
ncbi:hypothetical protein D3C80_2109010 [compost metagenome]